MERSLGEHVHRRHRDRAHLLALVDQLVEAIPRLVEVGRLAKDGLDGIRLPTVPVDVEDPGKLLHDVADQEHIHVHKVTGHASRKIFIGDVTASHHDERAICDEQLVVHPVVEAPNIGQGCSISARNTLPRATERVEQAHLDVGKRRQALKHRIRARGVEIVDQEPHPDAALRSVAKAPHEQPAGTIVLDQIVLNVERGLRPADQLDSRVQCIGTERHEPECAQGRVGSGFPGDAGEWAIGGRRQCRREGLFLLRWQHPARRQAEGGDEQQRSGVRHRHGTPSLRSMIPYRPILPDGFRGRI